MLAAYFDIKPRETYAQPFGKPFGKPHGKPQAGQAAGKAKAKAKAPRPMEACTTSVHAKFEPLPPEKNVPRPAEEPGQSWSGLDSATVKEDDVVEWDAWGDEEQLLSEDEEMSEPDFEPESLDLEESLGSSLDDPDVHAIFGKRARAKGFSQPTAVYSGPELCCEDEDFDE